MLHGLLRVRAFTQDDAHVFCTEDQITDEVASICEAIDELYARFGFDDVKVELSTRPEKSMGTEEQWEKAEAALPRRWSARGASTSSTPATAPSTGRRSTSTSPTRSAAPGSAAPAARLPMPERFELYYTGADNEPYRPVMIHRALLGSIERFTGILIEHYAGDFPIWLGRSRRSCCRSPTRPDYAARAMAALHEVGLRAALDGRPE